MKATTFFLLITLLYGCGLDKTEDILDSTSELDFSTEEPFHQDCSVPLFGSTFRNRVDKGKTFFIYDEGTPQPPGTNPDQRNETAGEWEVDGGLCKMKVEIGRFNFYDPSYKVFFAYEGEGFDDEFCTHLTGYYSMKKSCDAVTVCKQGVCEAYAYDY
jgi:hypothetical protein